MEDLKFEYYSRRSIAARFGVHVSDVAVSMMRWSTWLLILLGAVIVFVAGWSMGWAVMGVAVIPFMISQYVAHYVRDLPPKMTVAVTDRIEGSVLGHLPARPTPADVASAVGRVSSGQFMGARLGISPSLLSTMASTDASATPALWRTAEDIRVANNMSEITGAVLAVAIVRSFPQYESVIAQIHLDDSDLDKGIIWQQHLIQLIKAYKKPRRTGGVGRDWSFGWIPTLQRFGQNISEQIGAGSGLLTVGVASHVQAIDQLVDTFGSGGRQNALLVGRPGVGKTTIIHAFAEKLLDASAKVPDNLRFRQVFLLDSSALISAAPGRGELENLITQVLNEAYRAKNIIVCLDNAQLFFEEGVGSVDLSNVLQPILEAGNLRMILAMDEQRFLEIGQRNPTLLSSINRINIPETDRDETITVLQEQLIVTEVQRHVTYMLQAIKEAYRLSERYVHDLAQPGKALKLLESSAGYSESGLVTINSVQQAIEKTLDVKISVASDTEDRERLLNMEELIHKRMVNQTRAVSVVSDALRRARAGVRNENRPIGTFLFLGPTGVGKTELSKALADVYFGGEGRMIRIDLNEYVRAEDVTRLIADGAEDPTSLTAQVMKQPFSVVLLDEIEKAAPEVLATLLQLLDEGILRDIRNREVSFRDAIVIATSNAGADRIREYIERGYEVQQFEHQFVDELINSGQFRPEFLNRFDEIVVFRPFTKDELIQVCDLILAGVNKTLEPQKVSVIVEDEAKLILVDQGYDPRLGARPMRRVIQKAVENTVAKQMLSGTVNPGDMITITAEQVRAVFDGESPHEISAQ
ncbi:ATP-dependent Clp protease ATP-binding subunit [Candidatus Saccharibacteria bacterium oral taxon 955]|nr:ATP-dependent Clp protease ATP-binding subunit [Candidatus Saccharibacteria bacterium oral taxon 955]